MPGNDSFANAESPLTIPTYDGSGQCVHPDVVWLDRAFYPAKYLMAFEPYPHGDPSRENPSLLCSEDGTHWLVPPHVTNPLVPPPPAARAWHSDADILNYKNECLHLYYRYNSGKGETTLLRKTSSDGIRWTPPVTVFTVPISGEFASPALVEYQGRVCMFYVDTTRYCVNLTESTDGLHWVNDRSLFRFPKAWHLDSTVSADYVYLLLNDDHSLFLLRSRDLTTWFVFHKGDDLSPTGHWTHLPNGFSDVRIGAPLLAPAPGGWDNARIYRGTLLLEGTLLRLWYSAQSSDNVWKIGYTDGLVPT